MQLMLGQIYSIFMQATRRFSHVSYVFKFMQGLSRSTVLQYILRYILFISCKLAMFSKP
jgi:hypothetical protein